MEEARIQMWKVFGQFQARVDEIRFNPFWYPYLRFKQDLAPYPMEIDYSYYEPDGANSKKYSKNLDPSTGRTISELNFKEEGAVNTGTANYYTAVMERSKELVEKGKVQYKTSVALDDVNGNLHKVINSPNRVKQLPAAVPQTFPGA